MIKEKIYKYFDKEKEELKEKTHFNPSSLTSCKRKLYYKMKATEESNPIDNHTYVKFAMGDAVHLAIQNLLKKDKNIKLVEMENLKYGYINKLEFRYRLDYSCLISNIPYILEIKSTYMSGYNAVEQEPKEDHVLQLFTYMVLEQIDNGILLYVGRDNGFMVEYVFNINNEKYNNLFCDKIKELELLKENIDKNILPDKDYQIQLKNNKGNIFDNFTKDKIKYKSDWQCSYCTYKNLCWEKELKEIENNKFYIDGEFIKEEKTKSKKNSEVQHNQIQQLRKEIKDYLPTKELTERQQKVIQNLNIYSVHQLKDILQKIKNCPDIKG